MANLGLEITSGVASGGVAHILDTSAAYVAGTLLSVRTGGTAKLVADYAGNLGIPATAKVYLDGVALSGNTYIHESAADTVQVVVGGTTMIHSTATAVGISTASPTSTFGGVDIASGGLGLILGADNGASTRTNATSKNARFGAYHYTNAEEPVAIILGTAAAAANTVDIGGGSGVMNAATEVNFYTAANVTTVDGTKQLQLDSTGHFLALNATGGLGYGTGAGGAVTQITSRTTGVTLNKVCGAITLVSAAGSATPASFTVTDSAVAATDVIRLSQKSGTDKYILLVTAVAAGSFEITAYTTGGTTTEQPVINFAVLKAVAA